jgi:riboflavin-specific deaminase-like protein
MPSTPPRASTGIPGLDYVLGGGFPTGHVYLVEGDPGSGKTTVALQFLREAASRGEPVVYVTLSETATELGAVAASHGWSLTGITIHELPAADAATFNDDDQYTFFHPSEVELGVTMKSVIGEIERVQPTRVVFDSRARLPLDGRLVTTATEAPVLVVAGPEAAPPAVDALTNAGVEVLVCGGVGPARVRAALDELGRREVAGILLEGGPTLAASFLAAGEIDELRLFYAPLLLGGADSRPLLAGEGPDSIAEAARPLAVEWERSGEDMLARVRMREW